MPTFATRPAPARFFLGCLFIAASLCAGTAMAQSEPRFDLLEFEVLGNTVLPAEDIERAVYPFLGEQRALPDVEAARAALEKLYRDRGYGSAAVDIPEQRVADGVVRLQVTEARIVRTRVTGARYFSQDYILEKVDAGAEGEVPHFPTLQTQLGSVNRTADRRVAPVLRPGKQPGTSELDLAVEDRLPLHGSLELNNHRSPNTSEARLAAGVRYDNLFQRDHSIGLEVQLSPQHTGEVKVYALTYSAPVGDIGQDTLALSYTESDSNVSAGIAGTNVLGKGRLWGLRRNVTLDLREGQYHLLTLSADYKDYAETVDFGAGAGLDTPITYLPLGVSYLGLVDDANGRWQIGAALSAGLRGLVNRQQEFADKRYGGNASYALIKLDLAREQKLGWPGWTLNVALNSQLTGQPLISNEQFVIGGSDSVRGYLESEAAGDQGLRMTLELRSRDFAGADGRWLRSVQAHAFADAAGVWSRDALGPPHTELFGTGFGLNLGFKPLGSLALDVAWALRDHGSTRSGDVRVHARGAVEF